MGKIINLNEYRSASEAAIPIERTEEFHKAAKELDGFIAALPLTQPNNDRLVNLIIKQVQASEQGAFAQGFRMGVEFAKWDMENPED